MNKLKLTTNEEGFSLIELVVACAVAVIIGGIAIAFAPDFMNRVNGHTDAYEACGLQRESEINNLLNGNEPNIKSTCSPTATPAP